MASPFLGVYTASYAYTPRDDQELTLAEGDLLYILEKSPDDDWWKAKKKSSGDDDEPVGLVPATYIQEVRKCPFSRPSRSLCKSAWICGGLGIL
jgi:actin cytoskeleton-regulatory complex protein SLA1